MAKRQKIIQSFNSGELSPLMDQRIDQNKYNSGNRTMENFIPLLYGGAERRPGLEYINDAKSDSAKSRLVSFEHSVDDTYILEFANQVIRVYKDGARQGLSGFERDLNTDFGSATGDDTLIAHWLCDENATNTTVDDSSVSSYADHNGTADDNTDTYSATDEAGTANSAFDIDATGGIVVADSAEFSFNGTGSDTAFSILACVQRNSDATGTDTMIAKWGETGGDKREWELHSRSDFSVRFQLYDVTNGATAMVTTDDAVLSGGKWHIIVATYDGRGGNSAADGIEIYVDWVAQSVDRSTHASYDSMVNNSAPVGLGRRANHPTQQKWDGSISNMAVFDRALTASEVVALTSTPNQTEALEITTPYLTADLFSLKFEQSADVMFITHPDYEPRKLSRLSDTSWTLEAVALQTGPFRDQNDDTAKTITASATTGSITLTANNHSPFVTGTTAGHVPSGSLSTSKSQTGALFRLVQAAGTSDISDQLDADVADDATTTLTVPKGVTWDFTTNGTWGAASDPATIVLERSYDSGTTYETVHTVTSAANKNTTTSGTEDNNEAIYRARVSSACTANTEATVQFSIRDTSRAGVVQITAVASATSATATVITTLASTDPTHRWSEGSFSNYRGWPIDVTISPEERLTFVGNKSEPLTQWGSLIGDFTEFKEGTDDDDPVTFTLVGTGQQNRTRWVLSKDTLVIGTVGGEHLLGASKDDEAMTPSNVRARLQTTYGSEDISGLPVNQAVLFVERGGLKIREFLYNFEADAHRAEDLTVFSNHITESGIVNMAFQRTPDPTLWCVRSDGQLACMTYERDQDVFAWYRVVTGTSSYTVDSVVESVAVIYGGAGNEDEVWISVLRQINGGDSRTIERFNSRDLPSSASDYKFVDSYITDTGGDTGISGLDHLEGEVVQVWGDGLYQGTKTVSGGAITADTAASKYQVGLQYTSTVKPMKLNLADTGLTTTKRINRAIVDYYETIGGEISPDGSNWENIPTGTSLVTGSKEISIPGGYSRNADITVRQTEPKPITLISLSLDVGASRD
jgi:hypothetical protein